MEPIKLTLFALLWLAIIYSGNSLAVRSWKKIEPKMAILYFMTVALIGLYGEIFLDTTYNHFVGHPLWRYNILPIHHAYTASFAVVTWGLYGFHLYLLHGSLGKWAINKTKYLVLIFGFEALVLEALLTISARLLLGRYMYYYLPGDLWHVSSVQNFPFYLICGYIVLRTLERFRKDPIFFSAMSAALLFVLVFMV
jgi:hypothetical protein